MVKTEKDYAFRALSNPRTRRMLQVILSAESPLRPTEVLKMIKDADKAMHLMAVNTYLHRMCHEGILMKYKIQGKAFYQIKEELEDLVKHNIN
jgi:Fe2+ or Zn2+ uptake regulation protein